MNTNISIEHRIKHFINKKGSENMYTVKFRKTLKKIFIAVFLIIIFSLFIPGFIVHAANEKSGNCGKNLTWTLDNKGTLTITGTGEMDNGEIKCSNKAAVKKVIASKDVESIGRSAFFDFHNLQEVNLPGVTNIGELAFTNCTSLQTISMPKVIRIGNFSFQDCRKLSQITMPNVETIGFMAFKGCSSLRNIGELNELMEISSSAFMACTQLQKFFISDFVIQVLDYTFEGCTNLQSLRVPTGLYNDIIINRKTIGIPDTTNIYCKADGECGANGDNLTWTLDKTGKLIISGTGDMGLYNKDTFWDPTVVNTVVLPQGLTCISAGAFRHSNIQEINIPDSVKFIGAQAFAGALNLKNVIIPTNVIYIGDNAFFDCLNLSWVQLPYKLYNINRKTRLGVSPETCVFYVDKNGTTSTRIDKKGMIWLKEESDGTSAWYGIDNTKGQFPIGSKFWVRWLSVTKDSEDWNKVYNKLDDSVKAEMKDNDKLWIFKIGVTDPAGKEVKQFAPTNLYIQLGSDWKDENTVKAVFIAEGMDEAITTTRIDDYWFPDDTHASAAKATLSHFSDYAVYESSNAAYTSNNTNDNIIDTSSKDTINNDSSYFSKTADNITLQTLFILSALLVLALAGLWVSLKKRNLN